MSSPSTNTEHERTATVAGEHAGMRADRFLAEVMELFPRSQIQHRAVRITVNGAESRLSRRLQEGDCLVVSYSEPAPPELTPEPVPLSILYESERVIVINKVAGQVVHPGAGNWSGTIAQGLLHHVQSMEQAFSGSSRPGIVHRLDKDTSGVLIAAKDPETLAELAAQFKARRASKHYLALVKGTLPRSHGQIETGIMRDDRNRKRFRAVDPDRGKHAVTEYRVLRHYSQHSFVSLRPRTGRTHQLRVHMASVGCPIVGDPVYARRDAGLPNAPMMLHAYQLRVYLVSEARWAEFTAPLPDAFKETLRAAWGLA